MTNRVTFASGTKNCTTRKMNMSTNQSNTAPAPPPSALRRSSLGAPIRRRASMQTSLPTISEHHHHGNTKKACGNEKTASSDSADGEGSDPKRNYQRRRSSVSFSSETPEVKEYRADTTPEHFYSERDILQFREEAKFERQQFRRASTGSSAMMYLGQRNAPPPGSYPYIGPMARRGSNSSNESDGSAGNNSPSSLGSNPNHPSAVTSTSMPLPVVGLEGGSAYVPMITFADGSDQKKEAAAGVGAVGGLSARMSHSLNLAGPSIPMPLPSGPVAPGTRRRSMDTSTSTQASPSYQFSNSGGFSVPLDQVRQHLGSASTSTNPADHLKGAQFVSVSCPIPSKPSTARIA